MAGLWGLILGWAISSDQHALPFAECVTLRSIHAIEEAASLEGLVLMGTAIVWYGQQFWARPSSLYPPVGLCFGLKETCHFDPHLMQDSGI
jgi:hypothetical protein